MHGYTSDVKQFKERFEKAKNIRTNWEGILREAYEYNLPSRQMFNTKIKGKNTQIKVFDDTAQQALQSFSNTLKQRMFPYGSEWAKLEVGGLLQAEMIKGLISEDDIADLQLKLDRNMRIVFKYLQDSNFDNVVLESIQDMAISTGALLIQDTGDIDRPVRFHSIPADQLVIEDCIDQSYINVWRERQVKYGDIDIEWSDRKPDTRLDRVIAKDPTAKVTVIEGTIYNHETKDFDYKVYIEESDCKVIYESKYKVSPWVVFRWNRAAGEVWGRGSALQCLNSTRYLNALKRDIMKNNSMMLNPPMMADTSRLVNPNSIKIQPNAIIRMKDGVGGAFTPLQPLYNGSQIMTAIEGAKEHMNAINSAYYIDAILQPDSPVRTATEVSIANQRTLEQQISAFSRLDAELISPLIRRVYSILSKYGILNKIEFGDISLETLTNISSTTTITQANKMDNFIKFQNMFGSVAQMFGAEQAMAMVGSAIKIEDLPNFIMESFGISPEIRLSQEESKQRMAQAQEQMQMMAQAQAQMQQPPQQPLPPETT